MLDRQNDQTTNLNNTAMTSNHNSVLSRTGNEPKPQDINKAFAASFVFTVALGMF
jgi:hypothetical protein